jgi:radical SAM superfamily enzyme YgiQ (UPF0313 family)
MSRIALISFLTNSINTRLLSSYLKSKGHEAFCYFCEGEFNEHNLNALVTDLREMEVSFVGVSLVTDDFRSAVIVTREIKAVLALPVIWGGAHANIKPEESLRHADMICMGEGEEALLELADALNGGGVSTSIKNIWFRTADGIIKNEMRHLEEDLDKYPFPDFDMDTQYVMNKRGFSRLSEEHFRGEYSIMTSRGCPYKCKYCYNNYRWEQYKGKGKYLRTRSIWNVIAELKKAKTIFGNIKRINFWDDSFVARHTEDFERFRELYAKDIALPFFALIEPMVFNFDKIRILKDCGLCRLQVGIQSGSERVNREVYNRPVSNNKMLDTAEAIHQLGISVIYDLIFNNPYETREDLLETIRLLLRFPRPFFVQGYNLIFYPGTAITEKALRDGYISLKTDELDDFSTIQGKKDSPIAKGGLSSVSDRFYSINYDSHDKVYLNSIISLFGYKHVPNGLIKYFASSETAIRTVLLRVLIVSYIKVSEIKRDLFGLFRGRRQPVRHE